LFELILFTNKHTHKHTTKKGIASPPLHIHVQVVTAHAGIAVR